MTAATRLWCPSAGMSATVNERLFLLQCILEHTDRQTDCYCHRQTDRQTAIVTDRQTDWLLLSQTDRQTDCYCLNDVFSQVIRHQTREIFNKLILCHLQTTRQGRSVAMLPFLISAANSTQPSIPPGSVNQVPACLAGVRRGEFTCVRWQVTLCDPIWQVTLRSCEMSSQEELYISFAINLSL